MLLRCPLSCFLLGRVSCLCWMAEMEPVLVLSSPSVFQTRVAASGLWVSPQDLSIIPRAGRSPEGVPPRVSAAPRSLFGVAAVLVEWSSEDVAYGSTVF